MERAYSSQYAALYGWRCAFKANNCIFRNNGGVQSQGVLVYGGTASFTHCSFRGNTGYAGAEFADANVLLTDCIFQGNTGQSGGGLYCTRGAVQLLNCTLAGNTASIGGGCYSMNTNLTLLNCVISGNRAEVGYGGGLMYDYGSVRVTNCTFIGNKSRYDGAGIATYSSGAISNCIFRSNTKDDGGSSDVYSMDSQSPLVVSHSLLSGWIGPSDGGNLSGDPLLSTLPGPDGVLGTADDEYRLKPGSICIDAGDNRELPSWLTTDRGGTARYVDDPSSADVGIPIGDGPIVDMGAYEAPATLGFVVTGEPMVVTEGTAATIQVSLASQPSGNRTVTVVRQSGDTDLTVTGGSTLAFDTANWQVPQTVTIAAAVDADRENGTAIFKIQATGIPGRTVLVREKDTTPLPAPRVLYVNGAAGPSGDGSDWGHAFTDLQAALQASDSLAKPVEIWVAQGTYKPTGPGGDRNASFALRNGVRIYGSFAGVETHRGERDLILHPTVLSGDLNGDDLPGDQNTTDNSTRVVTAMSVDSSARLDGLTVTGGTGLYVYKASPTISRCQLLGASRKYGAEISDGKPVFVSCTIAGSYYAYYNQYGSVTLENCVILGTMVNYGYLTMLNCTMPAKTIQQAIGLLRIRSSILWGSQQMRFLGNSAAVAIDYSCVQGWDGTLGGTNNTGADPMFVDLSGFDGVAGTLDDNLGLLPGSPAADAGDNTSLPPDFGDLDDDGDTTKPLPLDVAGRTRSQDDPLAADTGLSFGDAPIVDMGAYEGRTQRILLAPATITVPEGGMGTTSVALAMDPGGPMTVTVSLDSGDGDISVQSGQELSFDSGNYSIPQEVTLAAAQDLGFTNESSVFKVSAPRTLPSRLTGIEADDEPIPPVIYVDWKAHGSGVGTSWADAFPDLRSALNAAGLRPGVGEVWVAEGTYAGTNTLIDGVSVYGGFTGTETARSQRDPEAHKVILDGQQQAVVVVGGQIGASTVLDGFTIARGAAYAGGGLYVANCEMTVSHCRFEDNHALALGGAVALNGGHPVLRDCTFTHNSITDDISSDNYIEGGAIYLAGSALIQNCRFIGNEVRTSNKADFGATSAAGGAIAAIDGGAVLVGCEFSGNRAARGTGRFTSASGGAIYCLVPYAAPLHVINCTFHGNTAESVGGGLCVEQLFSLSEPLMVDNCIFWGNHDSTGTGEPAQLGFVNYTGSPSLQFSCIQGLTGNLGGAGNIGADPLFRNPAGPDGAVGTDDDDLQLSPGSPCIDAGNNAAMPVGALTDLNGHLRFLDDPTTADCPFAPGTCGTAPIVDMGAYEFVPTIPGDYDHDGDVDVTDMGQMEKCALGPAIPFAAGCAGQDLDLDGDVDQNDFGIFQRCYSGAGIAARPECAH